jgi:hypothetical protein
MRKGSKRKAKQLALLTTLSAAVLTGTITARKPDFPNIKITSMAFQPGGIIPEQFTCKGANQNPPLEFGEVPAAAKSLALVVDDPDAPAGRFSHWLVWNIDPSTRRIAANSSPAGAAQGRNDFGKVGYGGPCPPSGVHRYFFTLLALDQKLELKPGTDRPGLERALGSHVIAIGKLMGHFGH